MTNSYNVFAGDQSGLLQLLMQMGPSLLSDYPLAQLAYMNSVGNVQPTGLFSGLPSGPTLAAQELQSRNQQFVNDFNLRSQDMAQRNSLARESLAMQAGLSEDELAMREKELALQKLLGLENIDLGEARLALERKLGIGQLKLGQDRLGLDTELGRGNLELGNRTLTEGTRLRERDQALTGQNMLAARATRQLVAPGGSVIPSMQPILGRSRI